MFFCLFVDQNDAQNVVSDPVIIHNLPDDADLMDVIPPRVEALEQVRMAVNNLMKEPAFCELELSVRNAFYGKSMEDAIDACIENEDVFDGIELFTNHAQAEAFRTTFPKFTYIPDATNLAV